MPRPKKDSLTALTRLALPQRGKYQVYRRVLDALSLKRRKKHLSLSAAARESGTTVRTMRRYAGATLEMRSGRLDVKSTDALPRPMRMLTPRGEVTILTKSAKTASRIARYNNAIREFLNTGDARALRPFVGKALRGRGERFEFVTDPATIQRLARAGAVHFLDVYDSEAAA